MSNSNDAKTMAANYDTQRAALRDAASSTVDPCLVAKYIAVDDARVRDLFLKKVDAGFVFRGVYCIDRSGNPENKYVVFNFECVQGAFCLVPPAFMVVINLMDRYVVAIVDPYIPSESPKRLTDSCSCNGEKNVVRGCLDCDVSADVTVSNRKVSVTLAGYVIDFDVPDWVPDGHSVTVKYHGCGCYCTKGGRYDAYYNGRHITGQELWGDCN